MSKKIKPYWEWEHYQHGFFDPGKTGKYTKKTAHFAYVDFFSSEGLFEKVSDLVFCEWVNSCNSIFLGFKINPVSWLGQASVLYACDVSSIYSHGYNLLPKEVKSLNNLIARERVKRWQDGVYRKISKELLRRMETERLPKGYSRPSSRQSSKDGFSSFIQSDMFSNFE